MAYNTLKCVNCNIVICELLSYVQYKHDVMDKESLMKMCDDCFSETEVESAKKLLFESVSTKQPVVSRRRGGKKQRNLDDIVSFFMHDDMDIHLIPVFVARDLQKLPPTSIDHVDTVTLMKDVLKLKNEQNTFKEMFATVSQLRELQIDVDNLKYASIVNGHNVNLRKRGGYVYDSGPSGLPHSINSECAGTCVQDFRAVEIENGAHDSEPAPPQLSLSLAGDTAIEPVSAHSVTHLPRNDESASKQISKTVTECETFIDASLANKVKDVDGKEQCTANNSENTLQYKSNSFSNMVKKKVIENKNKNDKHNNEWTLVQNKKKKSYNRFIARTGKANTEPEMKFKAAEIKIPLFISNVNKETSEKDICNYIKSQTDDQIILQKISMKIERSYNAYKILVNKHKLDMYLNDNLWPEGIKFSRFIHFKTRGPAVRSRGLSLEKNNTSENDSLKKQ